MLSSVIFLASLLIGAYALPASGDATPALQPRAVCTPVAGGSSSVDDSPAIASAIASCGKGGTIIIPAGRTYHINSILNFAGCAGCDFQLEGTLKLASDTDYWEGKTGQITVTDIASVQIRSLTGSGVIDANGQDAWDRFAGDSSYRRPTTMYISGGSNIQITGFTMKNPPNVFYSLNGGATNALFSKLTLSAVSKSSNPPKNTDGFDIGESTHVTMTDLTVTNDDDCIAFKPGSNYVTVDTITCTGSHGISVGSLGSSNNDEVQNIYVANAVMINSAKAAGIKTYPGGSGHGQSTVTNVTYDGFQIQNCDYAIQIQSCYGSDESECVGHGDALLTGITFKNFAGTTSSSYAPVTANLDCGDSGTCDVTISGYSVKPPSGSGKVLCANTPGDLGVSCTAGASG